MSEVSPPYVQGRILDVRRGPTNSRMMTSSHD